MLSKGTSALYVPASDVMCAVDLRKRAFIWQETPYTLLHKKYLLTVKCHLYLRFLRASQITMSKVSQVVMLGHFWLKIYI